MSVLINGKELAEKLQDQTKKEVRELEKQKIRPGLVVLIVGDNPASHTYVKNKALAAERIGIHSKVMNYSADITEDELIKEIQSFNQNEDFHGILVQLPLPEHINADRVLLEINPIKDVDGFHPMNLGRLLAGVPHTIPCTPYGIMKMFEAYDIDLSGKRAVILGRSNIVGKPMGILMLAKDATVTYAHSKTENLIEVCREADILVVAIGQGHFVTKEFIKPGAVVIDVGMNRNDAGKLIGDVKFDEVEPLTSYITPVPRGVGPMTITMLMQQTVEACRRQKLGE